MRDLKSKFHATCPYLYVALAASGAAAVEVVLLPQGRPPLVGRVVQVGVGNVDGLVLRYLPRQRRISRMIKLSGVAKRVLPRLGECFRQIEAEVVINSINKIHQIWEALLWRPLYSENRLE